MIQTKTGEKTIKKETGSYIPSLSWHLAGKEYAAEENVYTREERV